MKRAQTHQARRGQERRNAALRIALPVVVLALVLLIWEAIVRINHIPPYVLPGPGLILRTLVDFAYFAGVGAKTTMGMGQVIPLSRPRGEARS